jgi:regulator of protease activity HflC (stomatin/prohibitin superfamily)
MEMVSYGVLALLIIIFGVVLSRAIRIIPQASAGIVERLGRYHRTLGAGLVLIIPFIDRLRPCWICVSEWFHFHHSR